MPSAKAVLRIDWTRIGVAAPGLRPTASEARPPMRPTPRAAPRAARPTWMLPPMPVAAGAAVVAASASMGRTFRNIVCWFLLVLVFSNVPTFDHGQAPERVQRLVMMLLRVRLFAVRT